MRSHKLRGECHCGRKHCPAVSSAGFHTVWCGWQPLASFTQQPAAGKGKICVEGPSAWPGFTHVLLLQGPRQRALWAPSTRLPVSMSWVVWRQAFSDQAPEFPTSSCLTCNAIGYVQKLHTLWMSTLQLKLLLLLLLGLKLILSLLLLFMGSDSVQCLHPSYSFGA